MANPIDFDSISRVLVTKLRHHGDVLLASPVLQVLKNRHPHLQIDALVYADTADMLSQHPALDSLHCIDRQWKKRGTLGQFAAEKALLEQLKARQYDLLIHLTEHWRGAWIKRLCGIPLAVTASVNGRNAAFWRNSFTHTVSLARAGGRHTVEVNLDHLRVLGIHPEPAERSLVLTPGAAAQSRVDGLLAQAGLLGEPFIHIHPGSRWAFKCWPEAKMSALINQLHTQGHRVVMTGAPGEFEQGMAQRIQSGLQQTVALDLTAKLSLKELAAVSHRAALFIGVDSAPMHIAAAMQTPTVALFGPSGDNVWGPWGTPRMGQHIVITSPTHDCRPCGRDGCGGSKVSDCLVTLPVDTVLAATRRQLQESPRHDRQESRTP